MKTLSNILKVGLVFTLYILFIQATSIILKLKYSTIFIIFICIFFAFLNNIKLFKARDKLIMYCGIFILKLGLLIYDTANKCLPMTSGDYQIYHMFANDLMEKVNGSIVGVLSLANGTDFYTKFNALSYILLENKYNISYLFTFIFSLILTIYLYKTALLITKDENKSETIVLLWMMTPLEAIYSITFLKEAYLQMFFIISLYNIILYFKYNKKIRAIIALISAAICSFSHSGMISIVIAYSIFIVFYKHSEKKIKINITGIIVLTILFGISIATPIGSGLTTRFKDIDSSKALINSTQRSEGSTNYINYTPENTVDLLIQTPYRFFMLAASPLPWQVNSLNTAIAWILDGILQYILFLFYFIYFFKIKPKDKEEKLYKQMFFWILILTFLIFAWGTNNYGSAMRHRLKLYPMNIIFICYYWTQFKSIFNKKNREVINATFN